MWKQIIIIVDSEKSKSKTIIVFEAAGMCGRIKLGSHIGPPKFEYIICQQHIYLSNIFTEK